jgi:AraC-like DNA-binding protein
MIRLCAAILLCSTLTGISHAGTGGDLAVFPREGMVKVATFSDRDDSVHNGRSMIYTIAIDREIIFVYELRAGYEFPYCGFRIRLADDTGYCDISSYDSLLIELKSSASNSIRLYLLTDDPEVPSTKGDPGYRYLEKEINCDSTYDIVSLPLAELTTLSWWYEKYGINKNYTSRHLDKSLFIEIVNGLQLDTSVIDSLFIRSISFRKSTVTSSSGWSVAGVIFIGAAIVIVLAAMLFVFQIRNRKSSIPSRVDSLAYRKVDVADSPVSESSPVIEYLLVNYTHCHISVDKVAKECGVLPQKISAEIKERTGLSFRAFLNTIRIKEARRLLEESGLSVSEIAYKVGYNNLTHFNRVFKKSFHVPPSQFRSDTH